MEDAKIVNLHGPEWFQRLVRKKSVDTENVILTDHARQRMLGTGNNLGGRSPCAASGQMQGNP